MDDNSVISLLASITDPPEPASRVSIAAALRRGRRRRLLQVGGSALAVVAVAAVVAVPRILLSSNTERSQASASPSSSAAGSVKRPAMPTAAPATFNVLVPYAAFGWLPAGYSEANIPLSGAGLLNSGPTEVDRAAVAANGAMVSLAVDARAACATGAGASGSCPPAATSGKAPDVNGRPAWWIIDGHGIAWEYAPGAWADVHITAGRQGHGAAPGGNDAARLNGHGSAANERAALQAPAPAGTRDLVLKIADAVKYAQQTPLVFDLRLASPLPADWSLQEMGFHVVDGRLLADGLVVGPAADTSALSISATKPLGYACSYVSGQSSYVTKYGVHWEYRVLDDHIAKNVQMLCSMQPIDRLDVNIYLDMAPEEAGAAPLPGSHQLGGAFGVYARLHLLGLNPSHWTADPLG
ncbi:MAG: hypothetical protein ACRDNO_34175 [Trebonia sp.]